MAILAIKTYPDSVLSLVAAEVVFPLDLETKYLIRDMWNTVDGIGVGLAAPQVGVSKRICIICMDTDRLPKGVKIKNNFVMINPKITFYSEIKSNMVEGCLSFPEEYWNISRSANIICEYYNEKGKKDIIKASGWMARVILHEVDHLDGKLFIKMGGTKIKAENIDQHEVVD